MTAPTSIATSSYDGTRYDLTVTAYKGTGRGPHHVEVVPFTVISWETGGEIDPKTRATAYVPVGTRGYPDGRVLVGEIVEDGHGHHDALLTRAIDLGNRAMAA